MRDWFAGLNQREQLSVLVLAVALGLYLLYMLAWAPLADRREQLEQQNRGIATSLHRVDAMVSEIMRLRESARSSMGPRFDIKGFHDTVLGSGPVPLPVLGDLVERWIAS